MKIYEAEKSIANLIEANTSVAYTSSINIAEPKIDLTEIKAKAGHNPNQPDLFYLESVLVSTNWNKNDDVFSAAETWKARHTPVDKMFNYMHRENDIIGHITSAYIMSGETVLASDTSDEQMPQFFDIITGAVLYRKWSDPELQARMDGLIQGIAENKWFVSMEVLFRDFDYAITDGNEHKVIARNDETAFLTKHLRAYGGDGVYNSYKVGRLLKKMVFSGKGIVDKPANERSHIISYSFNGTNASLKETFGSELMTDTVSKSEYDSLKAELASFKAEAEKAKAEQLVKHEQTIATLTQEKAELTKASEELETVKAELETVKALSTEQAAKLEEVKASLEAAEAAKQELENSVAEAKKAQAKADRVAALVAVNVDNAKALEIVEKFASANDEMFKEVVALHATKAKDNPFEKKEDDKKKKDEEADASELDDVETEAAAGLGQDSDEGEELQAKASAWFTSLTNTKTSTKE